MIFHINILLLESAEADMALWLLLGFMGMIALLYLVFKFKIWKFLTLNQKETQKANMEDILKQLYHVEESGRSTSIIGLSGALGIPSTKMFYLIEEMTSLKLIITKDENIVLSEEGKDYALRIIRVHRLWEKYLSEKTGIDKLEWHDRAEQKEHQLTSEQTEELYQELGRPLFDPHGDPIPTEHGQILEVKSKPLSSLPAGTLARIKHIEDEPEVIYKQIIAKKLHIGSQVKVIDANDTHIRFYCEGNEYNLSYIVACNISVTALNEEEIFEESKVRLSSLEEGEDATILGISSECRGAARRRLMDLGFIKGTKIVTEFPGPNKNPKAYKLRNTLIALRNDQADLILIEKEEI